MAPPWSGLVAGSFLLAAVAAAAPPAPAPSQGEPPLFGSAVDLVSLDLVVRDRAGNAIRDLRPDEVEVYEDGLRQQVTEFRAVTPPALATAQGGPRLPAAKPEGTASSTTPPVSGATPPATTGPRRGSLVALVFDQLSVHGRPLAQKAARSLLERQLDADTFVAMFRIDGRLMLVENFTRERPRLVESLDRATLGNAPAFASVVQGMTGAVGASRNAGDPLQRGYDTRELRPAHTAGDPEAGTPMDGDGPLAVERKMANVAIDILRTSEEVERTQRGNRSLDGLLSVVHGMRDLPGRKTVVYLSEGLQVPPWLEEPFRALASEANRAGVSIYSVDVRGLRADGRMDDARAVLEQAVMVSGSQRLSGGSWNGVTREQAREFETVETTLRMDAQGTLDDLAKGTGGFLIADSNDLERGLRRLAEDTRHYYELAYVPSDPRLDGRFHRVRVRLRRPGASVQSREGYFAIPHAVGEPVYAYEGPLLTALAARHRPTAFAHQSAVFRFRTEGARVQHAVVVAAPLAAVTFRRDERAGRYLGRVSLLALVEDARGDVVAKLGQDYVIEGPLADLDATRQRRLRFARTVALAPGSYTVAVAVRDGLGERTGCSETRVVVAPPVAEVRLSSLVALAGAVPIGPASPIDGAPKPDGAPDDPFRVGELRLSPALGGRLRAEQGKGVLAVYYLVYAQPGQAAQPRVSLEIAREGHVVRGGPVALAAPDASGTSAQLTRVALVGLAPGDYTLRVSVAQGPSTAAEELPLHVAAPR